MGVVWRVEYIPTKRTAWEYSKARATNRALALSVIAGVKADIRWVTTYRALGYYPGDSKPCLKINGFPND